MTRREGCLRIAFWSIVGVVIVVFCFFAYTPLGQALWPLVWLAVVILGPLVLCLLAIIAIIAAGGVAGVREVFKRRAP